MKLFLYLKYAISHLSLEIIYLNLRSVKDKYNKLKMTDH